MRGFTRQARPGRVRRAFALLVSAALLVIGTAPASLAAFTGTQTSSASFGTDTLSPPTGLSATSGATISLSWSATPKTWATGYHVYRATASAGPYSLVATVTPRTTVSATDAPADGTYYYTVRAYFQGWESTAAGPASATATTPDTTPPTIAASVISKTTQYLPGSVKPSASVYVYANVTDPGANASGVATVTADISTIKAGSTAVALVAGSYPVGGVTYGYRSAAVTIDAKPAGTYAYSIRAVDVAGNVATRSGFSVIVDTTVPAGSDIQTTNGGTAGRPDAGDTIVYTYTEQIDPQSVLSGWTGATTAVTVRITNSASADTVAIWNGANTAQLPLGSLATGANIVTASAAFAGTMVQSGGTITITLGSLTSGTVVTNATAKAMTWTPSATATDAAGNACSTAAKTETGTVDLDF